MKKLFTFGFLFFFVFATFAQKKDIVYYYKLLKPKIVKELTKQFKSSAFELKLTEKDIANGFLTATFKNNPEKIVMPARLSYDIGLWVDAKGNHLIGVFEYSCSMGCASSFESLKIYNSKLKNVTSKYYSPSQVRSYFKSKMGSDFPDNYHPYFIQIPKKGTTIVIKLQPYMMSTQKYKDLAVELQFNYNTGSFTMVKK